MRFLSRFALKNPVAIVILTVIVAIAGVISSLNLKEELLPNFSFPVLMVITSYPGAGPATVVQDVTKPLETAFQGIQNIKTIQSTSRQGLSQIEIEFTSGANLNSLQQKVRDTVAQVQLPTTAGLPQILQFSFSTQPILYFAVSTTPAHEAQLRRAVQQAVVPALQGVAGAGGIQTAGAAPPEVQLQFSQRDLARHGLTVASVLQSLQADNAAPPLGTATFGARTHSVQLNATFSSLASLRSLRIPLPPNPSAALQPVGRSLKSLGSAVGQLGQGEGQIGRGVGLLQVENRLIVNLQAVQGQLFGAELALAKAEAAPPQKQNPAAIARLTATVRALESAQTKLFAQLRRMTANSPSPAQTPAPTQSTLPVNTATTGKSTVQTVPLGALATVRLAPPPNASINRTNGNPSVLVTVGKTESANTVSVAAAVRAQLRQTIAALPFPAHVITLYDASVPITQSVDGLLREALLGALFAAVVILFFLRNSLTTLIAVVSIPVSLLIALIFLHMFQITLNVMTLGGMAVATGRVVDDSIVVIENIFRTWKSGAGYGKKLVLYATGEVANAITTSTITTIAVFLPLAFVGGIVGSIFAPFALTVVFALVSSLAVALTVVPMLAWLFVARKSADNSAWTLQNADAGSDGAIAPALSAAANAGGGGANPRDPLHSAAESSAAGSAWSRWQLRYRAILTWCLNHKAIVILVTSIALIASGASLRLVGSTFIPQSQNKFAMVNVTMPAGSSLSATNAKTRQAEHAIGSLGSAVLNVNTQVGSDSGQVVSGGTVLGSNQASIFLSFTAPTNMSTTLPLLRNKMHAIAGTASIHVLEVTVEAVGNTLDLVVTGPDYRTIQSAARTVTHAVSSLPGLVDVQNNLARTQPEITVTPNAAKAAAHGLTAYQIASDVRSYLSTTNIGTVSLNGQTYNFTATAKPTIATDSLHGIGQLPVATANGATVPLSAVANVSIAQTPISVLHRNGHRYAEITGDFSQKNTGRVTAAALKRIAGLHLPAGVHVSLAGQSQQTAKDFSSLIQAILVATGMVYIVMLIAFGEWTAPFSILFAMPVALIGAFFGTVIARQPVSVSSLVGILMLMGIVVTNAIVLVDRVEKQRQRGLSVRDALLEAGTTRLRPILMTAIATVCALSPLAFGASEGALISQGLAVVVIGGLVTSTILTLAIVPVVYELLHRRKASAAV